MGHRDMRWTETDRAGRAVVVTAPDRAGLLADLARRFEAGAGFSIATLNLDHIVKLRRDADFREAYLEQTHVTADGNPIVWLSRLAGQADVSLIPGSELIDPVSELAAQKGVPVALFGSTDASLEHSAAALRARYPSLQIPLTLAPAMGFDPHGGEAHQAIEAIRESGARLVFLALGAPKQEVFAAFAQSHLPQVGFLSIGAGLDFISGQQQRAPLWVRRLAAEWLWRMASNPRRLAARYAACLVILPGLMVRALFQRLRS